MKMQVRRAGFDHYVIEPASEEDRARSEANVEGRACEFRDLGHSIRVRRDESHPRAAFIIEGETVVFYNPTEPLCREHVTTLAEADALARELTSI